MAVNTYVELSEGLKMPSLGYGTWQATLDIVEEAVEEALQAGYRHIDTAYAYKNEESIGKVINRWLTSGKLKREDLFIVTKLPPIGNRSESVSKYLKHSLKNLQLDYVDLYLVHLPFGLHDVGENLYPLTAEGEIDMDMSTDHLAIWKAMEDQVDAGLTKSIGISNFNIKQITRILNNSRIKPATLQIELHAYFKQKDIVEFCKKNKIVVTAYSPLGAPGIGQFSSNVDKKLEVPILLKNPVLIEIAEKNSKTAAQVLLRHALQKGFVVIPKSTTPARIRENTDLFDFELDKDNMESLDNLDQGPKGRLLDFLFFVGIQKHPEYPFNFE